MFQFGQNKRRRIQKPRFVFSYTIGAVIGIVYAGAEIPWSPVLSIIIFAAFGATLPLVYKYGVKGEDPSEMIEKIKDLFSRGSPKKPEAGKVTSSPKPEAASSQAASTRPSTTTTREYRGYKERFNLIKE